MGGVCCACTQEQKYRFKNFVVSVYPEKKTGGPDEEALDKLRSYAKSNPERIPRICRKINKILIKHVRGGKEDRVMVSLRMLQNLIENTPKAEGFVPHTMQICTMLFRTDVSRYRIGAADLLAVLCHKLAQTGEESPRRLVADSKAQLLPALLHMAQEGRTEKKAQHRVYTQARYSAIVALGNLCTCLGASLSGSVSVLIGPLMENLLGALQERARTPLRDGEAEPTEASITSRPAPSNGELAQDHSEAVAQCVHAATFAIGAVGGCVTTATVEEFLSNVAVFFDRNKCWRVPLAPPLVYASIVAAMQSRPQELGFTVYQSLCRIGLSNHDGATRTGVLRALCACLRSLTMSGGRPKVLLNYIVAVMRLPLMQVRPHMDEAELAEVSVVQSSVLRLLEALLQSTYRCGNFPQLQLIIAAAVALLSGPDRPNPSFVLRTVAVAAPYARTVPLVDRAALGAAGALRPFLYDAAQPAYRILAAQALAGLLAGRPSASAALGAPAPAAALLTDPADVVLAQEWVQEMVLKEPRLAPLSVLQCVNVLTALMAGQGVGGMPFCLTLLWQLQGACAKAAEDSAGGAKSSDTVGSVSATSALGRAWLHATLAVLASMGRIYRIPKLSDYATDLLARRAAAKELAACFEAELLGGGGEGECDTQCGLAVHAEGVDAMEPLDTQAVLPPVSRLVSFGYVANIIVDAELAEVTEVFGASDPQHTRTAIEAMCFATGRSSAAGLMAAAPAADSSRGVDASVSPADITLTIDPQLEAAAAALQVHVTSTHALQESRSQGLQYSTSARTNAQRMDELLAHYDVNAETPPLVCPSTAQLPLLPDTEGKHNAGPLSNSSSGCVPPAMMHAAASDIFVYAAKRHAEDARMPLLELSWAARLPSQRYVELA